MFSQNQTPLTQTTAQTQPVQVFSPTDHLPAVLSGMTPAMLSAHITKAKRLIQHHKDVARNGEPSAEHYYFFIPEVAADMADARYTLSVVFAEIKRRQLSGFQEVAMN